jgi:putative flippase GtrA/glycosyltransferase involved in cell wall biosynthesis
MDVVVVPCYDEERRLNLAAFRAFLAQPNDTVLLFVDDGSRDGTLALLKGLSAEFPTRALVLPLEQNHGKAEAVRRGILAALEREPRHVGYWDADLATPLDVITDFQKTLSDPALDVVLGARVALLGRHIERRAVRHYLGRIFATAASLTLNAPVYDTQCGAKLFRVTSRTRALFDRPFSSRWIFDVELIARYLAGGGTTKGIYEYALARWTDVGESKLKSSDFIRASGEMLRIYREYPLGQPLHALIAPLTSAFSRYVAVGGAGTALHYVVLVAGVETLHLPEGVAAFAGATAGAIVNYFLNYHLTFTSRVPHRRALPRFAAIALLGSLLSGLGVHAGVDLGVHYVLAQVTCTVLFLVLGFILNRALTF